MFDSRFCSRLISPALTSDVEFGGIGELCCGTKKGLQHHRITRRQVLCTYLAFSTVNRCTGLIAYLAFRLVRASELTTGAAAAGAAPEAGERAVFSVFMGVMSAPCGGAPWKIVNQQARWLAQYRVNAAQIN